MTRAYRSKYTPIGIDAGLTTLRAVQLERSKHGWASHAVASVPRLNPGTPLNHDDAQQLKTTLNDRGFRGKQIVLAVPTEKLLTGTLELPPRVSGAPIDQLATAEIARLHRKDPDSFEIACWDLPMPARGSHSTHVMAVAVMHQDADPLLDLFEKQGLDTLALDTQASAITRACNPLFDDPSAINVVLDLGWSHVRVFLLHQGIVVYERSLTESSLDQLGRQISDSLPCNAQTASNFIRENGLLSDPNNSGPDSAKTAIVSQLIAQHLTAMVEEMRISFSYVQHRYPNATLGNLLLIGNGASLPGLVDFMNSEAGIKTKPAEPAALHDSNNQKDWTPPMMVKAMGLALYSEA
jgi:Tfp pilus assembly PilM family ATPase